MSIAFPLGKLEFDPPSNWTQTSVGHICDEHEGDVQTGPFGSQLHASDYSDEGVPVVMPQDMADGKILTSKIARVDSSHVERLCRHMIRTGDIVFSRRGDVARFAVVNCAEQGWLCGTGSMRIRLNCPLIDTLFLRRFLQLDSVGKWLNYQAKGITMPNLNTGILRALPLYFPSLPEQRRIAAILDKADAICRKREEGIRLTEELLRSTFLEMFGDPATNPKSWEVRPFGELAKNEDGRRKPVKEADRAERQGEYPYYGASGIIDNVDEFLFNERTLLIAEDGANLLARSTPIAFMADGKYWVNNHAHVVSDNGKADLDYLRFSLNLRNLNEYVTGSAQPKLNQASLNRIPIALPPISAQRKFAVAVQKLNELKNRRQAAVNDASSLFGSLVQRAFRGEL